MPDLLFVTRNFPPMAGGMERLAFYAYKELRNRFPTQLICPRGGKDCIDGHQDVHECRQRPLLIFLLCSLSKCVYNSLRNRPAVIIGASGLMAPAVTLAARLTGAKSMIFVHGLDLVVGNVFYKQLFLPALRKTDRVIANSDNTMRLAIVAGVEEKKISVIHPGVELPDSRMRKHFDFRKTFRLGNRPVILSVGRLIKRKGLIEFIENAMPLIRQSRPDACLVLIGNEPRDALNKGTGYLNKLETAIDSLGLRENVLCLGRQNDEVITAAYEQSDVFIMPLIATPGDVEGFGMVAIEAAAYGLPTVGFKLGGLPDAVSHGESGYLVDAGNYNEFSRHVIDIIREESTSVTTASCQHHAERFSWARFGMELNASVKTLLA